MTEYRILQLTDDADPAAPDTWRTFAKSVVANGTNTAIRQALADAGQAEGGVFVAVPVSNWKPQTVKPTVQTRLTFSPA